MNDELNVMLTPEEELTATISIAGEPIPVQQETIIAFTPEETLTETEKKLLEQIRKEVIAPNAEEHMVYVDDFLITRFYATEDSLTMNTVYFNSSDTDSLWLNSYKWSTGDTKITKQTHYKFTKPTVPTNVSSFTNDAGYLTEHQSLTDYALKSEVPTDTHINSLIDTKLGVIENGSY